MVTQNINATLITIGFRVVIGIATAIGLPVCGFVLSRAVAAFDGLNSQVGMLLTEQVKSSSDFRQIKERIDDILRRGEDHEKRIQYIERSPALVSTRRDAIATPPN